MRKEIPATIVFEDDLCLAFKDVNPVAQSHFILVAKEKRGLRSMKDIDETHESILGHLMVTVAKIAKQ